MGNGDALVSTFGGPSDLSFDVNKNNFWSDAIANSSGAITQNAVPLRVGTVDISIPALSGASYSQAQDEYRAEVRSTFATSTLSVVERSRVLATSSNLLATDITNSSNTAIQVTANTKANQSFAANGATTTAGTSSGATAWVSRTGPNGAGAGPTNNAFKMSASLSTRILGATATVSSDSAATSSAAFSVPAGGTATVVTQIQSTGGDSLTNTPADPVSPGNAAVQAVTQSSLSTLDTAHLNWWSTYWHASSVNLSSEPTLMRYYYGSLYILASSNRAGSFAPGLYGWNGTDTPRWQGDYTTNYNVQAPYYGVYSSNHPELAASYYKAINSISDQHGVAYAASRGYQGTYFRTHYGPLGIQTERDGNPDWGQRTNALESAINFIKDYLYTKNLTTLQQTSYPFLLKVADFWDAYLVKDSTGRYVVNSSDVAENDGAHNFNPTTALAYLRTFYSGMLTASSDLNVDASRRAKWQDILTNLSQYTTLQYSGKTVFSFSENNPSAEANPYPYNLYPVFPAEQVGITSPLAAVARNTISTRSYWGQNNSFPEIYPAAIKAGYPAKQVVAQMNSILNAGMGPNNFYKQGGGGLETVGSIEAIDSMLLESTDGVIRLFPNWTGSDASFSSLRAVGAFTVSSAMTGGVVQSASITSEKGGTLTVQNPWPGRDLIVSAVGGGTVSTTRSAGQYTFATTASTQYVLTPSGGVPSAVPGSVAVYGDSTASSSVSSGGWSAAAAVDGDTRSVAGSLGWSSSSSLGANHTESYAVDLRSPYIVSRVDLSPRGDAGQVGAGYPVSLDISVSTDGQTWTTASTASSISQPTTATPISYSITPVKAQFVRITGTSLRANPGDGNKYRMQLAEVGVIGGADSRTATATSSYEGGGWSLTNVVNGTTTSSANDLGWTSSANTGVNHTESVTVDMASARAVNGVVLYPRTDTGNVGQGFPVDYSVATSTDGSTWTPGATVNGQALPTGAQSVTFTSTQARYVRVTGTNLRPNSGDQNQYRMQFAEITVSQG